jgi:hypothetical protein
MSIRLESSKGKSQLYGNGMLKAPLDPKAVKNSAKISAIRRPTIDQTNLEYINSQLSQLNRNMSKVLSPKSKFSLPMLDRLSTVISERPPSGCRQDISQNLKKTVLESNINLLVVNDNIHTKRNPNGKSKKMKTSEILKKYDKIFKTVFTNNSPPPATSRFTLNSKSPFQINSISPKRIFTKKSLIRPGDILAPMLNPRFGNLKIREKQKKTIDSNITANIPKENFDKLNLGLRNLETRRLYHALTLHRTSTVAEPLDTLKNVKTKTQLEKIWTETTLVDAKLLNSRNILKFPVKKINQMIENKISNNKDTMISLGRSICQNVTNNVRRIVEPVREEFKLKRQTILNRIHDLLKFIISLKIPYNLIFEFPSKPYQNHMSIEFIESTKLGKADRLSELLFKHSSLLVYEYDHFKLTALHWAAKRNIRSCGEILIEHNSYTNALDIYGRSPLYYAIENQNVILVYLMLVKHASPWSPKDVNYIELSNKSEQIIYFLRKFRLLDLMMSFQKLNARENFRKVYIEKNVKKPF